MESHLLNFDFLKIPPTCGLKIKLYNVNVHVIRLEIDWTGLDWIVIPSVMTSRDKSQLDISLLCWSVTSYYSVTFKLLSVTKLWFKWVKRERRHSISHLRILGASKRLIEYFCEITLHYWQLFHLFLNKYCSEKNVDQQGHGVEIEPVRDGVVSVCGSVDWSMEGRRSIMILRSFWE